jgi:hypothetical protein
MSDARRITLRDKFALNLLNRMTDKAANERGQS